MKTGKTGLRRGLCIALALMLCMTLLPSTALAAKAAASATTMRLASTEGTVTVKNGSGQTKSVFNNMQLYNGWTVETALASYATLSLDSTKAIKLGAGTKIELRQNTVSKTLELYVTKGNVFFDVSEKLAADENMSIHTSTAICGIRGTIGEVKVLGPTETLVYLLEGSTEIINAMSIFDEEADAEMPDAPGSGGTDAAAEPTAALLERSVENLSANGLVSNEEFASLVEQKKQMKPIQDSEILADYNKKIVVQVPQTLEAGQQALVIDPSLLAKPLDDSGAKALGNMIVQAIQDMNISSVAERHLLENQERLSAVNKALESNGAQLETLKNLSRETVEALRAQEEALALAAAKSSKDVVDAFRKAQGAKVAEALEEGAEGSKVIDTWGKDKAGGGELPPTRPLDPSGVYENEETCTVTFDANNDTQAFVTQKVVYGRRVTLPVDLTWDGHEIVGWYVDKGCTVPYDLNAAVVTDFTLYAKWNTKTVYSITPALTLGGTYSVQLNDGTLATGTVTAAVGDAVMLTYTSTGAALGLMVQGAETTGESMTLSNDSAVYTGSFTMPAGDVTVSDVAMSMLTIERDGSTSSTLTCGGVPSGGGSTPADSPYYCFVPIGQPVTLTPTAETGYQLATNGIKVADNDDFQNPLETTPAGDDGSRSFTPSAAAYYVRATFENKLYSISLKPELAELVDETAQNSLGTAEAHIGEGPITFGEPMLKMGDNVTVRFSGISDGMYILTGFSAARGSGGAFTDYTASRQTWRNMETETDYVGMDFSFTMPADDLVLDGSFAQSFLVEYTPNGDMGSVTINSVGGYSNGGPVYAIPGETVSFTLTPEAGYALVGSPTVMTASESELTLTQSGDAWTFTMPDEDVAVEAEFVSDDMNQVTPSVTTTNQPSDKPELVYKIVAGGEEQASGSFYADAAQPGVIYVPQDATLMIARVSSDSAYIFNAAPTITLGGTDYPMGLDDSGNYYTVEFTQAGATATLSGTVAPAVSVTLNPTHSGNIEGYTASYFVNDTPVAIDAQTTILWPKGQMYEVQVQYSYTGTLNADVVVTGTDAKGAYCSAAVTANTSSSGGTYTVTRTYNYNTVPSEGLRLSIQDQPLVELRNSTGENGAVQTNSLSASGVVLNEVDGAWRVPKGSYVQFTYLDNGNGNLINESSPNPDYSARVVPVEQGASASHADYKSIERFGLNNGKYSSTVCFEMPGEGMKVVEAPLYKLTWATSTSGIQSIEAITIDGLGQEFDGYSYLAVAQGEAVTLTAVPTDVYATKIKGIQRQTGGETTSLAVSAGGSVGFEMEGDTLVTAVFTTPYNVDLSEIVSLVTNEDDKNNINFKVNSEGPYLVHTEFAEQSFEAPATKYPFSLKVALYADSDSEAVIPDLGAAEVYYCPAGSLTFVSLGTFGVDQDGMTYNIENDNLADGDYDGLRIVVHKAN